MTYRNLTRSLFAAALLLVPMCPPLLAASLEDLRIIKISPADQTAVVMMYDEMRVLRVGDRIDEDSTVQQITEGRMVFDVKTDAGIETVILRIENGKQAIQRIRKTHQKTPILYTPVMEGQ
ncbi:MAG: hypothetical protein R3231_07305 [bacterium]|nr:hypothetical protein [bacterium]